MFTPCHQDGSLDERGIAAYIEYLVTNGHVDALFARSGLGQMYSFSVADTKRLADIVMERTAGRLPVLIGCSGVTTDGERRPDAQAYQRESIELCQYAGRVGAAAAVLLVPTVLAPRGEDLPEEMALEYLDRVAAATEIPIVLYQPPEAQRRFRATPSFISEVSRSNRVVGMKISTSRMDVFVRCGQAAHRANFALIAGDETVFLFVLLLGGTGVIGQGCTTHPEILRAVYERVMSQDFAGASRAAFDTHRAVDAPKPAALAGLVLQYLRMNGVQLQPFSRDGEAPPSAEECAPFAAALDAVRAPYRNS